MKYFLELAAGSAFAFGTFASAQNADWRDKDIVASHRQSTGATSTTRATVSTVGGPGGAKSSKLDQQLAKIERERVKSGTGKAVHQPSSQVPKRAEPDAKNTKPINFGHQHQTTKNKVSNNRGKE